MMEEILLLLVVCFLWLDKYAVGEFGISQPLVVSSLAGLGMNEVNEFLKLGILLQPIWLSEFPFGKNIVQDAQGAGICACISFIILKTFLKVKMVEKIFVVALLSAIVGSMIGTLLDGYLRKLSNFFAQRIEREKEFQKIALIHISSLPLYAGAGIIIGFIGVLIAVIVVSTGLLKFIPSVPYYLLLVNSIFIGVVFILKEFAIKKNWIQGIVGIVLGFMIWAVLKKP